ncbi:MAG TPA: hypothetical protein VG984_01475 [Candidatus Paceibacterota bacterium]|nr:hypothetical protein [Candidatus Paceibacterota bacterium]
MTLQNIRYKAIAGSAAATLALLVAGSGVALAQTTTTTSTTDTTGATVGVPNTGAGGDALATWSALGAAALAAGAATLYLARQKKTV